MRWQAAVDELGDLVAQTTKDIGQMCRRLQEVLGSIQNRHLGALVQAYLDDDNLMARFCKAPAAMSFHHAFIGGLLEHTLNAIEIACAICPLYPTLNRDLVVAGLIGRSAVSLRQTPATEKLTVDAALAIVVTAAFRRNTIKYHDRGYRMVLMEAGEAAQNLVIAVVLGRWGLRALRADRAERATPEDRQLSSGS